MYNAVADLWTRLWLTHICGAVRAFLKEVAFFDNIQLRSVPLLPSQHPLLTVKDIDMATSPGAKLIPALSNVVYNKLWLLVMFVLDWLRLLLLCVMRQMRYRRCR